MTRGGKELLVLKKENIFLQAERKIKKSQKKGGGK